MEDEINNEYDDMLDDGIEYDQDNWRQQRVAALRAKAIEEVSAPVQAASGQVLRWAWLNIIPSFGLTIVYINLHVFMRPVMPSVFCRLGEEWVPKEAREIAGEFGQSGSMGIGLVEAMSLIALDIALLCIIGVTVYLVMQLLDSWPVKLFGQLGFFDSGQSAQQAQDAMQNLSEIMQ